MPALKNCVWLNGQAEDAADFYVSVFPNSERGVTTRYLEGSPFPSPFQPGDVLTADFTLDGVPFQTLNGGPMFSPSEGVSFSISCADQAEVDYYWDALTADGGQEQPCGWLKDKFGVSWQVVPMVVDEMTGSQDQAAALRAMQALMTMTRIDIAAMEAAFRGA
ncbi:MULTISPECIES: VOC family protein [Arthrobacter]|uniref:VOC family protein n=2 Tax=Arthrobacter TaxID=1663 RepID=A0ABU9KPL7_9MICC|nr:VOC family protein [Arthrobacter sp. YJM1]MDP5228460.1 VOC family protein [Arthrobacter sp. YJM1]